MKFDPYAFLEKHGDETGPRAIRATCAIPTPQNSTNSTNSTGTALNAENALRPQVTDFGATEPDPEPAPVAIPEPLPAQPEQRPAPRLAAVPSHPAHHPEAFPNGVCRFTGRPRTWTGKVVSLEDWRRLSDWEREGPAGRLFCGICRAWVAQDGGCREPGCWNGDHAG